LLNNPIIPGTKLPTLTNPGAAGDLLAGKQLINQNGNVLTGTMQDFRDLSLLDLGGASGVSGDTDTRKQYIVKCSPAQLLAFHTEADVNTLKFDNLKDYISQMAVNEERIIGISVFFWNTKPLLYGYTALMANGYAKTPTISQFMYPASSKMSVSLYSAGYSLVTLDISDTQFKYYTNGGTWVGFSYAGAAS